jgi:hypothetical protein
VTSEPFTVCLEFFYICIPEAKTLLPFKCQFNLPTFWNPNFSLFPFQFLFFGETLLPLLSNDKVKNTTPLLVISNQGTTVYLFG